MQYLVDKSGFTKITEVKGTIQNIGKTVLEISDEQTANSGVLLRPSEKIAFDSNAVYVRCVNGVGGEARVIPFEVVGQRVGGGLTDFSLAQLGTNVVDNFVFSTLAYPNTTNPNLDGKTVLVLSVKDANETTNLIKYIFVDLAKVIDVYSAGDSSILVTDGDISVRRSQAQGNILSLADDGLFANLAVSDGVSGNFAVIGASGVLQDSGLRATDFVGTDDFVTFSGATSVADGTNGLVPAPQAGDDKKFLGGDGSWKEFTLGTLSSTVERAMWLETSGDDVYIAVRTSGAVKHVALS